jgi:hypothetical protein
VVSDVDSYGAAPESDSDREAEVTADFEVAAVCYSSCKHREPWGHLLYGG